MKIIVNFFKSLLYPVTPQPNSFYLLDGESNGVQMYVTSSAGIPRYVGGHDRRTITQSSVSLLPTDIGKSVDLVSGVAKIINIDQTKTLGFNFKCDIYNLGDGEATIVPIDGVTIIGNDGTLAVYGMVTIRAIFVDVYMLTPQLI